jgi:hypothetical protein
VKGSLETSNGVCVALYKRLDSAVIEVPNKPGQCFQTRGLLGEKSKPDALDLAAHEIPSSYDHPLNSERLIISDRSYVPPSGTSR